MKAQKIRKIILAVLIAVYFISPQIYANQESADFQMIRVGSGLSLHKEMFMLPVTYSDDYHFKQTEAVFQISAKHGIFGSRLYFAYTQISFWQAYDKDNSAPFRETNYNPEMFYRFKPFAYAAGHIGVDLGFEHESNGQKPPISRSWNLFYVCPYYYDAHLLLYLKFRYRIPEDDKTAPDDPLGDDNPDITDYLGYTDLQINYKLPHNHNIDLKVHGNLNTGRGGFYIMYNFPVPKSDNSFFTIRFSNGYGESLVDYKKPLTRIGIGISFMHN